MKIKFEMKIWTCVHCRRHHMVLERSQRGNPGDRTLDTYDSGLRIAVNQQWHRGIHHNCARGGATRGRAHAIRAHTGWTTVIHDIHAIHRHTTHDICTVVNIAHETRIIYVIYVAARTHVATHTTICT